MSDPRQTLSEFYPGVAAGPWDPDSIAGLKLYVNPADGLFQDAGKLTPAVADNDPVRVIVDAKSAQDFVTPADLNRGVFKLNAPEANGFPSILLDQSGADKQYFVCNPVQDFLNGTEGSVFWVVNRPVLLNVGPTIMCWASATSNTTYHYLLARRWNANPNPSIGRRAGGVITTQKDMNAMDSYIGANVPQIVEYHSNGFEWQIFVNGRRQRLQDRVGRGNAGEWWGDISAGANPILTIGARVQSVGPIANSYFDGYLLYGLVYDQLVSDTDKAIARNALANQFKIEDMLEPVDPFFDPIANIPSGSLALDPKTTNYFTSAAQDLVPANLHHYTHPGSAALYGAPAGWYKALTHFYRNGDANSIIWDCLVGNTGWRLGIDGTGRLYVTAGTGGALVTSTWTAPCVNDSVYKIYFDFTGSQLRLIVNDGTPVASPMVSYTPPGGAVHIGADLTPANYMDGMLQVLFGGDTNLSPAQITAHAAETSLYEDYDAGIKATATFFLNATEKYYSLRDSIGSLHFARSPAYPSLTQPFTNDFVGAAEGRPTAHSPVTKIADATGNFNTIGAGADRGLIWTPEEPVAGTVVPSIRNDPVWWHLNAPPLDFPPDHPDQTQDEVGREAMGIADIGGVITPPYGMFILRWTSCQGALAAHTTGWKLKGSDGVGNPGDWENGKVQPLGAGGDANSIENSCYIRKQWASYMQYTPATGDIKAWRNDQRVWYTNVLTSHNHNLTDLWIAGKIYELWEEPAGVFNVAWRDYTGRWGLVIFFPWDETYARKLRVWAREHCAMLNNPILTMSVGTDGASLAGFQRSGHPTISYGTLGPTTYQGVSAYSWSSDSGSGLNYLEFDDGQKVVGVDTIYADVEGFANRVAYAWATSRYEVTDAALAAHIHARVGQDTQFSMLLETSDG